MSIDILFLMFIDIYYLNGYLSADMLTSLATIETHKAKSGRERERKKNDFQYLSLIRGFHSLIKCLSSTLEDLQKSIMQRSVKPTFTSHTLSHTPSLPQASH